MNAVGYHSGSGVFFVAGENSAIIASAQLPPQCGIVPVAIGGFFGHYKDGRVVLSWLVNTAAWSP